MSCLEQIVSHVKKLPDSLQNEVLDFIEYLEMKNLTKEAGMSDKDWSVFSIENAMVGMEKETVIYNVADLKEKF